jgi:hypothetical protein
LLSWTPRERGECPRRRQINCEWNHFISKKAGIAWVNETSVLGRESDTGGSHEGGPRRRRLWIPLFRAPVDKVAGVEGDADEVGGDEAKLCGADADDADDGAIDSGDDPALPEFLTEKHGGEHG